MARFFAGTDLPPLGPAGLAALATFAALAASIRVTMICSRLNAATAASIVSATRSPVTDCPALVRPEYANVGMIQLPVAGFQLPVFSCQFECVNHSVASASSTGNWRLATGYLSRSRPRYRRSRPRHAGARHNACAAADHLFEFVLQRRRANGRLQRD